MDGPPFLYLQIKSGEKKRFYLRCSIYTVIWLVRMERGWKLDGYTISWPLSRTHTQRTTFYRIYISFVHAQKHLRNTIFVQLTLYIQTKHDRLCNCNRYDRTTKLQQHRINENASGQPVYTLVIISIFLLYTRYITHVYVQSPLLFIIHTLHVAQI